MAAPVDSCGRGQDGDGFSEPCQAPQGTPQPRPPALRDLLSILPGNVLTSSGFDRALATGTIQGLATTTTSLLSLKSEGDRSSSGEPL